MHTHASIKSFACARKFLPELCLCDLQCANFACACKYYQIIQVGTNKYCCANQDNCGPGFEFGFIGMGLHAEVFGGRVSSRSHSKGGDHPLHPPHEGPNAQISEGELSLFFTCLMPIIISEWLSALGSATLIQTYRILFGILKQFLFLRFRSRI